MGNALAILLYATKSPHSRYREREYLIDLCELYSLKEKENPLTSPTHSWQFVVFNVVPFAFLEDFLSQAADYFLISLISLILVCCIARVLYEYIHKPDWWRTLFVITPEHPSFKRISSGQDLSRRRQSDSQTSSAMA
ncbi:hypothetical protein KIN20_035024 [Parelaphostrongylus tenuis]|uniref:Uncharacterized protein n=1 Tax=Parelaphostrongylus tenuis TaxID=148309 RepID=A0AAD5RB68_PARTN|nr:hypothetical protein KIN20_035024 [Parelaphostrongylus tenuis]